MSRRKAKKTDTVTLHVPRKIFENRELCLMADRTGTSDNCLTGLTASIIKAGGGDLADFNLSRTTARKGRIAAREAEFTEFFRNFVPPKHAVLGWDGKLGQECSWQPQSC